jgi:peroxiredoxin
MTSTLTLKRLGLMLTLVLTVLPAWAGAKAKFNSVLNIGDAAPDWKALPGVDGKNHDLAEYSKAKVLVLIVTCNHCPVAKMYEERFTKFTNDYRAKGVQVVALSCNRSRADALEAMKERNEEKKFPFPYLYDETQKSGRAYGAAATPHIFVLNDKRKIAYMGAFDDQNSATKVQKHFVIDAVDALLAGREPVIKESRPRGCTIDYEDLP